MAARFGRRQRLRTRKEFDRVFRSGRRLDGRLFQLVVSVNGGEVDRLGLAVNRRVGGAVERNRARRLLRESFRLAERGPGPGLDIVVVAKPGCSGAGLADVQREWSERLRRFRRSVPGGASPARTR